MLVVPSEVMSEIHRRLAPSEVREWFRQVGPEIRDTIVAMAVADGIEATVKEVKKLYVSWLQLPRHTSSSRRSGLCAPKGPTETNT